MNSDHSPAAPSDSAHALLAQIRAGGELADIFHAAANRQQATTTRQLRRQSDRRRPARLARTAQSQVTEVAEASPLRVLQECRAGCSLCCRSTRVDVTPLEALALAEHIQEQLAEAELKSLHERLVLGEQFRRLPPEEQAHARLPCALLGEDDLCTVYAVRPLACAGVFSLSQDACQRAYEQTGTAAAGIPLDRPTKAATLGVSAGLQRALVEAGLDGNLYELHSALLCGLRTPRAYRRWRAGEDIFAECTCTDPHSPPRKKLPQPASRPALPKKRSRQLRIDKGHSTPSAHALRQSSTRSPQSSTGVK